MKYKIYCLVNPIDNSIFYVGRTTLVLNKRLYGHCSNMNNLAKFKIVSNLQKINKYPAIRLIQKTNDAGKEKEIIKKYFIMGHPLTNYIPKKIKQ